MGDPSSNALAGAFADAATGGNAGGETGAAAVPRGSPVGFPRVARLLDGKSFTRVFGGSRRYADRYWTLLVHDVVTSVANGGDGPETGPRAVHAVPAGARLGLAIAKKRTRRAVDRNRIKRVARESFRHRRHSLGARHVVLMNRDAATGASSAELRAALEVLWNKVLRTSAR